MNQILHIFRKDARHLYPEVLASLAVIMAFAWSAPRQWNLGRNDMQGLRSLIAPLLRILLPIAWLVLISRLVHDESLVGDRQFWITRPYRWTALLASKLLFLFVFLCFPFMLMQIYLLQHAGLDIRPSIPDLLLYQLRLSAIFLVPFFAIAAVTTNFAKLTLTLLLGLVYLGLFFAVGTHFMERQLLPQSFSISALAFSTLVALSLIIVQYATRRTLTTRCCLIALPMLLLLLVLVAPAEFFIRHTYPPVSTPGWIIDPSPARQQIGAGQLAEMEGLLFLKLPVHKLSLLPGERLKLNGVSATIDAPGLHWSSPFINNADLDLSDEAHDPTITIMIPRNVFDRVRTMPVDLHLQFASTTYRTEAATRIRASIHAFAAPDHGLCPIDAEGLVGNCRYAFRLPIPIDVTAQVRSQACDETATSVNEQPAESVLHTFIGSDDDRLAFDFDPVTTTRLKLVLPGSTDDHQLPAFLCAGSPITFASHRIFGRGSFSIAIPQLVLGEYAQRSK